MHNIRRKFVFVKNFPTKKQKASEISIIRSLLFFSMFLKNNPQFTSNEKLSLHLKNFLHFVVLFLFFSHLTKYL